MSKVLMNNFNNIIHQVSPIKTGSLSDMDVVIRASGHFDSVPVASLSSLVQVEGKHYTLDIGFLSTGEQKIRTDNKDSKKTLILEDANKCELSGDDIEKFAQMVRNDEVEFYENCWIEGKFTLSEKNINGSIAICSGFESNFGFEGVYESIETVEKHFSDEYIIEFITYLLKNNGSDL